MKVGEILFQLSAIATAEVTDFVQVRDGNLEIRSTEGLPKQLRCAIAAIEKGPGGVKVKFYDKLKALELLSKYMELFAREGDDGGQHPLLEAILRSTGEVTDSDLQEIQPQTAAGDDMVEPERVV